MAPLTPARIVKAALNTIHAIQLEIDRQIQSNPLTSFRRLEMRKPLLVIDLIAERKTDTQLKSVLHLHENKLLFLGEEELGLRGDAEKINLANEKRIVVLVDMVDGTDLLERGLSNWCSAMVFFEPQAERGKRIIATFVGIPDDGVYYATREAKQAWKHRFHVREGEPRVIPLPSISSSVDCIANASLCFYGQQIGNLEWVSSPEQKLLDHLKQLAEEHKTLHKSLKTRIYNLAGMPMMMKMLDSGAGLTRIDAVFDVCGQQPHDMVAGAYIASAAGAVLSDLDGNPIDLEESLFRPAKDRLWYVVAATEALAKELRGYLKAVPAHSRP